MTQLSFKFSLHSQAKLAEISPFHHDEHIVQSTIHTMLDGLLQNSVRQKLANEPEIIHLASSEVSKAITCTLRLPPGVAASRSTELALRGPAEKGNLILIAGGSLSRRHSDL